MIVLAGLQAVPDELLEAATLDGYGPVRRFFRSPLPLISPTLMFLAVVLVIFALQAFAQIDILTQGGPAGSTETLVFKIFSSQHPAQARHRCRSWPSASSASRSWSPSLSSSSSTGGCTMASSELQPRPAQRVVDGAPASVRQAGWYLLLVVLALWCCSRST